MKKPRLYLETSVWNFLFADDAPDKKWITKRFLHKAHIEFELYSSFLVIDEMKNTRDSQKMGDLLKSIYESNPVMLKASDAAAPHGRHIC